ncbi:MAG: type III secretion system chaperone [Pseudomonadota bacterium]
MLEHNQFWADTGGARMALDSESEEVLLIGDCVLADLTTDSLGATIAAFLVIHRTQQLILVNGIGGGRATTDSAGPMPGHIIA